MKKLIIYLTMLTTLVFADVNYGVTIGGGVGIGIPFTDSYDYSLDPRIYCYDSSCINFG